MDLYTLGALLYEMLTGIMQPDHDLGLPPHYSQNRQEMYQHIVNNSISFPDYLSDAAVDLLRGLLQNKPEERLGFEGGVAEVRAHRFFRSVNWDDVLAKKLIPPYPLNFAESYFDSDFTSSAVRWSDGDDATDCERERSQSNVEFLRDPYSDTARQQEARHMMRREEYVKSIIGTAELKECKAKKQRQKLCFERVPRAALELFQGYVYSREMDKKKVGPKRPQENKILYLKADLIKTKSAAGESNEPDDELLAELEDDLEEMEAMKDETIEFSHKTKLDEKTVLSSLAHNDRCLSFHTESSARNKQSFIARKKPAILIKQNTLKGKTKMKLSRTNLARILAAAETSKLILQKQSRAGESLIRLNDSLNDVISERQRVRKIVAEQVGSTIEETEEDGESKPSSRTRDSVIAQKVMCKTLQEDLDEDWHCSFANAKTMAESQTERSIVRAGTTVNSTKNTNKSRTAAKVHVSAYGSPSMKGAIKSQTASSWKDSGSLGRFSTAASALSLRGTSSAFSSPFSVWLV